MVVFGCVQVNRSHLKTPSKVGHHVVIRAISRATIKDIIELEVGVHHPAAVFHVFNRKPNLQPHSLPFRRHLPASSMVVDGGKKLGLLHTEAGECAVAALAKDGRNRMVIVQNTVNVLASRRCFQLHVRRQPFAVVSSRHIFG